MTNFEFLHFCGLAILEGKGIAKEKNLDFSVYYDQVVIQAYSHIFHESLNEYNIMNLYLAV